MNTAEKRIGTKERRKYSRSKKNKSINNAVHSSRRVIYTLGGRKIVEAVKPDFIRGFFKEEYLCLLQAQ